MSPSDDMTCRELTEFLADYLEGSLSGEARASFERHLAVCPPCVRYLDGYRRAVRLAKDALGNDAAPPCPVPPDLVDAVRAAYAARSAPPGPAPRRPGTP